MSVNKVILVGRLGKDPETRYMPNGDAVTNATMATSEVWRDKNTGQKQEKTEWHRLVFFRRQAEVAGEYLRKGSQIYIEGKLQTRKWQGQDGQDRYTTEIVVNEMTMLGGRSDNNNNNYNDNNSYNNMPPDQGGYNNTTSGPNAANPQQPASRPAQSSPSQGSIDDFDDDIPF